MLYKILCFVLFVVLWPSGPVLTLCKVPKYFEQHFLKILLLISTLPIMIQISGKVLTWPKKVSPIKKLPASKVESFLNSNFWPKYPKLSLHKAIKFGTLTQLACFIFLSKVKKMLWSYRKFRNWSFFETELFP